MNRVQHFGFHVQHHRLYTGLNFSVILLSAVGIEKNSTKFYS